MRADQDLCPIRYFLQRVGGAHPLALQPRDLMHIVDDFAIRVNNAVCLRLPLGQLDRAPHAEAEPGCFCYCNAHICFFRA